VAAVAHRLVILHRDVLALLRFHPLIEVGDHVRLLVHDEDISAKVEDLFRHVRVDAVHERDHGDHRRNADHHPEQRQDGAELVRPQRLQGDLGSFKVHGNREGVLTYSLSIRSLAT
jgi:hypothetical protein